MNLKELKEMIELMNENGLAEIEIENGATKVKVKKAFESVPPVAPVVYTPSPAVLPVRTDLAPAPAAANSSSEPVVNLQEIKSPMVGTFYRSPSPEAAPFLEIGQTVEVGQVVCIIEAMKLMNEIKSEIRGKVVEIGVDNAEPVEFGQALFRVAPIK